jgi:serine/threonine protein phosphatase PrpC
VDETPATYVAVTALSHAGLIRDHNEDSLAIGPWTLCATQTTSPQTLYFPLGQPLVVAVADGLGGHPGGEVASSLVVRELASAGPALDGDRSLTELLHACNRSVHRSGQASDLVGMGTTVAGVLVSPERVLSFNVGDSRVYSYADGELSQASVDDSPPLMPGQRTTSVVTQTLGGSIAFEDVDPHVSEFPRRDDVRWVICSDGLSDVVDDETLAELLRRHDDGRASFEAWRAAMDAGGPDNVTLALVSFGS